MFKLAVVQMLVAAGDKQRNLNHAKELIKDAADNDADVVLLPEAMTLGWTDPSATMGADEIPHGVSCEILQNAARENGVYLCSGMIERSGTNIFNAAVLIDPEGKLLLQYRKINELDIGKDLYRTGDRVQVVETPLGTFGVMICADAFVKGQVISRTLALMGAEVILSPSAWAVPHDHDNKKEPYGRLWLDNYQPVAREFSVWIAGASNVGWIPAGPWKGRKCIGCSLIINDSGEPVVQGPYGESAETILYVDVTLGRRSAETKTDC